MSDIRKKQYRAYKQNLEKVLMDLGKNQYKLNLLKNKDSEKAKDLKYQIEQDMETVTYLKNKIESEFDDYIIYEF